MSLPFLLINITGILLSLCMCTGAFVIAFKVGWRVSLPMLVGSVLVLFRWLPHLVLGSYSFAQEEYEEHKALFKFCQMLTFAGSWLFMGGIILLLCRGKLQTRGLPAQPQPKQF